MHVSKGEINSVSNGQHSCPLLLGKDGGYTKQNLNDLEQEDMGVFIGQGTSNELPWTITIVSPGSSLDIMKANLFSKSRDAFPISWTHLKA